MISINFSCKNCDFSEHYLDGDAPMLCPTCSSKYYRLSYVKEETKNQPFVNIAFNENERLSWALGCDEADLPVMQKQHPGAEFRKAPGGGYQMVIKNRTEKKRRMRERNFEEY